jgi:hypothetical protein
MAKSNVLNDTQVVTGEVRLSYVNLFEARKIGEKDKVAKYSLTILIPKNTPSGKKTIEDIQMAIKKAAEKGAAKHFNGRIPTNLDNISTLRDGDTAVDDIGDFKHIKNPELKDHMYLRLSSKFPPKVLNTQKQEIINPLEVYSGMYGRVSLTTFAYSGDGRRGISAVLNNVMITRDGEPLTSMLTGAEFDEE